MQKHLWKETSVGCAEHSKRFGCATRPGRACHLIGLSFSGDADAAVPAAGERLPAALASGRCADTFFRLTAGLLRLWIRVLARDRLRQVH